MRRRSRALGVLVLGLAGHVEAAEPKPGDAPPPEYYVEPTAPPDASQVAPGSAAPAAPPPAAPAPTSADAPGAPPRSAAPVSGPPGPPPPPPGNAEAGPIYDPPPPGFYPPGGEVYEPQPPPEPHHIAPRTALWLGARVGLFIPFGSAWARGTEDAAGNLNLQSVPWRDYVGSGPMFELDAGARLSRNYNVFALWERSQLGSGKGDPAAGVGKSSSGDSDFWGVGIRATSDPDHVGLVTELALGYRRARAKYGDSEIQFTDAPFEARLGIGAEARVNRFFSLSPMFTVGVGSFGKVQRSGGGAVQDQMGAFDQDDGHAWASFTLGGSFDLFGSKR
jgi:hypothetical protein